MSGEHNTRLDDLCHETVDSIVDGMIRYIEENRRRTPPQIYLNDMSIYQFESLANRLRRAYRFEMDCLKANLGKKTECADDDTYKGVRNFSRLVKDEMDNRWLHSRCIAGHGWYCNSCRKYGECYKECSDHMKKVIDAEKESEAKE